MSEFITKVVIAADNQTAPAVNAATKGIQNYAKAATAAQSQVRGASRQSRAALQQLGYQVQDISVQLQAGQSPFVVLAQQGSQVASIFGPGGAVIGALIAVGGAIAGNLLPNLFKSAESMETLTEKAKDLGYTLEELMPLTAKWEQVKNSIFGEKVANEASDALSEQIDLVADLYDRIGYLQSRQDVTNTSTSAAASLQKQLNVELRTLEDLAVKAGEATGTFAERIQRAKNAAEAADRPFETLNDQLEAYEALVLSVETPSERLVRQYKEADEALRKLELTQETYNRLLQQALDTYKASLPKQKEDVKVTKDKTKSYEELVAQFRPALALGLQYQNFVKEIAKYGLSEAQVTELKSMAYEDLVNKLKELNNVQEETKRKLETTTEAIDQTPLEAYADSIKTAEQSMQDMAVGGLKSLEDGMANLIAGTGNVKDAFRSMASSIISDLIRMQVQRSITGPLAGLLQGMSLFGGAPMSSAGSTPGVSTVGGPIAPVPSYSGGGYTGSGGRSGGMDGKGGFMAMLHPNETVIDHTKGGGAGVTIVQNINVTTGVQQTVRAEIKNLLPQITQATKQAVADSRQRGGGFSKALVGA